ncbi:g4248 [Coccomyxa viridis]|uniref:Hexosyltransferase n=1 Tax=Coccomyxa viridis TaxID=1274662 RepID=A0ABP1FRD8_9CHLO
MEKRNAIRETWGKLFKESYSSEVVVRFFVHCSTGEPCQETEAHFGDIIDTRDGDDELGPLAEGQEGVTQRVYLMFQHVVSNFDAQFVMKADDDTFINVPALLQVLHKLSKDTSNFYYVGQRLSRDWSLEEEKELAALAREDVGEDDGYLSTYMQGGAYILSKEAVDGIVALNHATGLRFLHYEDVAVGVWVSGMRLKYITDWDVGYRFEGHANLWEPDRLQVLKVRPP